MFSMKSVEAEWKEENQSRCFPIPGPDVKTLEVFENQLTFRDLKVFHRVNLPGSPLAVSTKDLYPLLLNIHGENLPGAMYCR